MNSRSTVGLLAALLGTGVLLIGWLIAGYRSSRANAQQMVADAIRVTDWAEEIRQISDQPAIASLMAEPPDRVSQRVRDALTKSNIDPAMLLSLTPAPATRVGRTRYQLQSTTIVLQDVTLRQIIDFSIAVADREGTVVRDLKLTSRSGYSSGNGEALRATNPEGERWDARLTLTAVIFSPISDT